ncbi:MAG: c-type cytochrome [Chloroflexota bacterium]
MPVTSPPPSDRSQSQRAESARAASLLARRLGLALLLALALLAWTQWGVRAQDSTDDKLVRGARLYSENCAVCHGPNGEGRVGARLAKNWPSIRPDLTVKTIIENGVSGSPMPAWSQAQGGPLSATDIDALVYYILSWETGGPPQITPWPTATPRPVVMPIPGVQGDPNQGALLFDQNCAVCHGPNGEGRIGATLAKAWAGVRPELAIRATIQYGVPGSPMPAWSQAQGGPLSNAEIDDLVSFIISLQKAPALQIQPTPAPAWKPSTLSGWPGALLFIVLLAAVLVIAAWIQRRKPPPDA